MTDVMSNYLDQKKFSNSYLCALATSNILHADMTNLKISSLDHGAHALNVEMWIKLL